MNQKIREKAANFLQKHLNNVNNIEKANPGSVNMNKFVTKFNKKKNCGIVCCMQGWLPNTYPESYKWENNFWNKELYFVDKINTKDTSFIKEINYKLWNYLIGITEAKDRKNSDFPTLNMNSSFRQVKIAWNFIIKQILDKKLDKYLNNNKISDGIEV